MVRIAKRSVIGSSLEILLKGTLLRPDQWERSDIRDLTVMAPVVTKKELDVKAVTSCHI